VQTASETARDLHLVGVGSSGPESVPSLIAPLHGGKKVLFPIPKHDQLMVEHFKKLIESGEFRPVIDRTYPPDQIVEAYRYVEAGQKTGNVVISLEGSR
jgi:NADPH:quinone reductase-like Zn-dependent oxidoreductase